MCDIIWARDFPRGSLMPLRTLCLVYLFFILAPASPAQTFDLDKEREHVVALGGLWRFHPGDDPRWSDPAFDDSGWPLIRSDKSWGDQGYKNMAGTAWYRAKVVIPEGEGPLAISVPGAGTNYQLFVEGSLIGGEGGMPPHEHAYYYPHPQVHLLPHFEHAQTVSLAFRVWQWPDMATYNPGGLRPGLLIGKKELIQKRGADANHGTAWGAVSDCFIATLEMLSGFASLVLFASRTREKEYLWFAVMFLLNAGKTYFSISFLYFHPFGIFEWNLIYTLLLSGTQLAGIAFYFELLRGRRNWLMWLSVGMIVLQSVLACTPVSSSGISVSQRNLFAGLVIVPIAVWTLSLLTRRAFEGLPDARLLVAPVLLQQIAWVAQFASAAEKQAGWSLVPMGWINYQWQWPMPFTPGDIVEGAFLIAMLAILVFRFTRTRRHEERLAGEFEAARTVQQILIPEAIPAVPGFTIETVYKPFNEVSGDFFQILNTKSADGCSSALVVIGDVSGKGMPAAMAVALLVGTVRTLAHYTKSPGEILSAMNQRMVGRLHHGFTTCLVLRAGCDGKCDVANAGHLSPYRKGAELKIENGLPLGLSESSSYPETTFQLGEGESLTLLTDGVVEARAKSGELFGFERAAEISTLAAEFIALTAQAFGQDDDITVLKLTRSRAGEGAEVDMIAPEFTPASA
jgi:sigma-B regulation protein RsbU (phosphoserine phosphatase)